MMSLPQVFLVIFFCFLLSCCTCTDTISSSQLIKDSETIVSQNGTFKLGFFSPPNSTYRYVGVLFNIPVKVTTAVWVANRDRPLNNSLGSFTISEDGNLVVLDGQKQVIWSSNVLNSTRNSTAKILDTGNLVLQDNSSGNTLWESFQHLSDSYLKGMKLSTDLKTGKNNTVVSWKSPSDPSAGTFYFGVRPLNIPELFVWNGSHPRWRSGPWNRQVFLGVPNMNPMYDSGITFEDDRQGSVSVSFSYPSIRELQMYYHLGPDGILRETNWYEELQDWVISWSTAHDDCDVYGKCGPFGLCDSHQRPICGCLNGYDPLNLEEWTRGNWTSGCVRRNMLLCQRNNTEQNKQDGFFKFQTVKVPDFAQTVIPVDDCRSQCLRNCNCTAYADTIGIGCMHWTGDLIDIMKLNGSSGADLYVRVAYLELDNKKSKKVIIAVTVILVSVATAIGAFLTWICIFRRRGKKQKQELFLHRGKGIGSKEQRKAEMMIGSALNHLEEMHVFDFQTLTTATANFQTANKLGQGGFGPVYKGKLPDGQEIAVKRLSRSSGQGLEEFMNEVVVISKLQHRNLVRLLGCCVEKEEKMLIYEFMPNGSLDSLLFGKGKEEYLDWKTRVNIIEGITRGLLYLHRDSRLRIIHRDLKASNILLDQSLNPKISDFGMARIFGGDQEQANTARVVGTYGYMSPEYAMAGRFSEKSDVYSFGVLLLEIISGRRNSSFYDDENFLSLLRFAWNLWNDEKITELIDHRIRDPCNKPQILRCIHIGLLCVQEFAKDRPTVSTVLTMLTNETVDLPTPKQPAFMERQSNPSQSEMPSLGNSEQKNSVNNASITVIQGR